MTAASPLLAHSPSLGLDQATDVNSRFNLSTLMSLTSLRCDIIRPTLAYLGMGGQQAEDLLLGTLLTMAELPAEKQPVGGIGPFGICASNHTRLWDQYLACQPDLASLVRGLASQHCFLQNPHAELAYNLAYATAMAWVVYQQSNVWLDATSDTVTLAHLWQRHYLHNGGLASDFLQAWARAHPTLTSISA